MKGIGLTRSLVRKKYPAAVVEDLGQFNPVKGENGRPYSSESKALFNISRRSPDNRGVIQDSLSPHHYESIIWYISEACPNLQFNVSVDKPHEDGKPMTYKAEAGIDLDQTFQLQVPANSLLDQEYITHELNPKEYDITITHTADTECAGRGRMIDSERVLGAIMGEEPSVSERWRLCFDSEDQQPLKDMISSMGGTYSIHVFETNEYDNEDKVPRSEALTTDVSADEAVDFFTGELDHEEYIKGELSQSKDGDVNFYGVSAHLERTPLTGTVMASIVPEDNLVEPGFNPKMVDDNDWSKKVFESPLP